ncbi:Exonuclease 1, partial [Folsomia candida]
QIKGWVVRVDIFCYFYKGLCSCQKIPDGNKDLRTQGYVTKYIKMLVNSGVEVVVVAGGRRLLAKKRTQDDRREARKRRHDGTTTSSGPVTSLWPSILENCLSELRKLRGVDILVAPFEIVGRLAKDFPQKTIPADFLDRCAKSIFTFNHKLVYDVEERVVVPLTPYLEDQSQKMDNFAGTQVHEDLEFQLALGNVDPYTLNQRRDLFDPSESAPDSIWSTEYLKEIFPTVPSASVLDYSPEEHIECMTCKCNDLDQEFETPPSSFRLHIKSRHGFGKCICETCGRFCNKPSQLVAHIRTHTLEKPFLCETCRVVSHKMRSRPSQEDSPAWHQGLCL